MGEHTGRIEIARSAEEVFAFVSDIHNLPAFLAGVRIAAPLDGAGRVVVEGAHGGRRYRAEGWLRADRDALTMEWGTAEPSDGAGGAGARRGYSGSLRVVPLTRGGASPGAEGAQQAAALELRLRIEAEPPGPAEGAQAAGRGLRGQGRGQAARPVPEAIAAALGAIRSLCEGTGATPLPRGRALRRDDDRSLEDSRPYGSSATMNPDI